MGLMDRDYMHEHYNKVHGPWMVQQQKKKQARKKWTYLLFWLLLLLVLYLLVKPFVLV